MGQRRAKRLQQLGIVMLGAYMVSGCPSPAASGLFSDSLPQEQAISSEVIAEEVSAKDAVEAVSVEAAPTETAPTEATPVAETAVAETAVANSESSSSVAFEVCAEVTSWQRPSEEEQAKQFGRDARYGEAIQDDALKSASTQFWTHDIISFTTYGLSARMEPVNLSGVWTAADDLWGCYENDTTMAINQGDRAEAWLLNQRIVGLDWQSDRYVMTVEPAATGMQVVLFERIDEQATLPLSVVTTRGETVAVASGDWQ